MISLSYYDKIDKSNIPSHIGIIMDGNGRWAKKRMLPRSFGHKAGVETIRDIVKTCNELKVEYLTLYAFSTENWNRPEEEVSALMKLLLEYLKKETKELDKNNVRINAIGDYSKLPKLIYDELCNSIEKTKNNTGVMMSLALNYGSRNDIMTAVKNIILEEREKGIDIDSVDEDFMRNYLSTRLLPDPDLIIRPSGELRLSNFLMWEAAYAEFWFSDINWPDFKREDLYKAIFDYQNRDRRFGTIS